MVNAVCVLQVNRYRVKDTKSLPSDTPNTVVKIKKRFPEHQCRFVCRVSSSGQIPSLPSSEEHDTCNDDQGEGKS